MCQTDTSLDFTAVLATSGLAKRYRDMAKMCGYWATARHLRNRGYSLEHTLTLLFG